MGRNLHWSIIAASEDQHLAGGGILERQVNTSELVAKSQREAYSSKTRAQGIVDSILKSLASARGRNPDGRSRSRQRSCGSPRPANQFVARRLRSPLRETHVFARQGGEGAAERLNVFAVVGGDQASRSPNPMQSR